MPSRRPLAPLNRQWFVRDRSTTPPITGKQRRLTLMPLLLDAVLQHCRVGDQARWAAIAPLMRGRSWTAVHTLE